MFDVTHLAELQHDRDAIEALMPILAPPDQVIMNTHLIGLTNSITFIEKLGSL